MKGYKTPLISVIMPVYNTARFLPRCIRSLLLQKYDPLEIICINNGSTDDSWHILQQYAQKYKQIRIYNFSEKGVANARNFGLNMAQGEWIAFIDSDDFLLPGALAQAAKQINDDIDMIMWGYKVVGTKPFEKIANYAQLQRAGDLRYQGKKTFSFKVARNTPVVLWNKLFRAEIIKKYQINFPSNVNFSEDNIFFWKYFLFCRNTFFISQRLYGYTQHDNSLMGRIKNNKKLTYQDMNLSVLEDIIDFYHKHTTAKKGTKEQLEKICIWTLNFLLSHSEEENQAELTNRARILFLEKQFPLKDRQALALIKGDITGLKARQTLFWEKIFSIRNLDGGKYLTFLGINIRIFRKKDKR